jgi:hypothetical protein
MTRFSQVQIQSRRMEGADGTCREYIVGDPAVTQMTMLLTAPGRLCHHARAIYDVHRDSYCAPLILGGNA